MTTITATATTPTAITVTATTPVTISVAVLSTAIIPAAKVLATGQTTSYAANDDGDLEKGIPHSYTVLTTGQYAGTTNITLNGKTEAHSNECVLDEATGLMWSRKTSLTVGPNSNGTLPWTVNGSGEGIYEYAAAANAASLAGYTDWRVPNIFSLFLLSDLEAPTGHPDATAFPTFINQVWSSSTVPNNTASAYNVAFTTGIPQQVPKTNTYVVRLLRGPTS